MIQYYERYTKCCNKRQTALTIPLNQVGEMMAQYECHGHFGRHTEWRAVVDRVKEVRGKRKANG